MELTGEQTFYRGEGCPACFNTGYRGRIGVFEILILNSRLRSAITRGASREELQAMLDREGSLTTLTENCQRLVLEGITTAEEARRVTTFAEFEA